MHNNIENDRSAAAANKTGEHGVNGAEQLGAEHDGGHLEATSTSLMDRLRHLSGGLVPPVFLPHDDFLVEVLAAFEFLRDDGHPLGAAQHLVPPLEDLVFEQHEREIYHDLLRLLQNPLSLQNQWELDELFRQIVVTVTLDVPLQILFSKET